MTKFNSANIKVAAGTLYAAPLGTTEPSQLTGAWPAGWVPLGYTDQGSVFTFGPQTADIVVEEEYFPVRTVVTGYAGTLVFVLAEPTRDNLALVMNAGIGSSLLASTQGNNIADGSPWQEGPLPGAEVHVMLGWDAQAEGNPSGSDPFQRLIIRQAFQDSPTKRTNRKGNNKATWDASFKVEKPGGVNSTLYPFRYIFSPSLAS